MRQRAAARRTRLRAGRRLRVPVRLGVVLALAAGTGLGLLYAWVIDPVKIVDADPAALSAARQAAYVELVARTYAADGDLERAQARLAALGSAGQPAQVVELAQRRVDAGAPPEQVAALAALASALGAVPDQNPTVAGTGSAVPATAPEPNSSASAAAPGRATPSATPAQASSTATRTPTTTPIPTDTVVPTITPRLLPTRTPTPTPIGALAFVGQEPICDPNLTEPLIQVITQAADGSQAGGVEVIVEWDGGFDHFYTGLKPDLGPGYGDFVMEPGIEYNVHLADSPSATVAGLLVSTCTPEGAPPFPGSWRLLFRQSAP